MRTHLSLGKNLVELLRSKPKLSLITSSLQNVELDIRVVGLSCGFYESLPPAVFRDDGPGKLKQKG